MIEEICNSKFEIYLRDVCKDDEWMLVYIIAHILKDPSCVRDIYHMLRGDDTNNVEVIDHEIDFILLDRLSNYECHASSFLRNQGIKTESELLKFVYTRNFAHECAYWLGPSAIAAIAAYMNIRNIIPKDSDMSDVVSQFMNGTNAEKALRLAKRKV